MRKLVCFVIAWMVISGCRHNPPPPPGNPSRVVAVVLNQPLEEPATVYVDDVGGGKTCTTGPGAGVTGYCEVLIQAATGTSCFTVKAKGYNDYRIDALPLGNKNLQLRLGFPCDPAVTCSMLPALVPTFTPLPRLITRNWYFVQEDGTPFTVIEASDFALYQRYLNGEDITPVLQQRRDVGFNFLRVFGAFNGSLGHFVPGEYGDAYYTKLKPFADLVASICRCYVEFTVFADTTQWLTDVDAQIAHFGLIINALATSTNVFIEVVNESDQPINQTVSLPVLAIPATLNSSHGSNGAGAGGHANWGVTPFWHYTSIHSNLDPEWQRVVGHNCYEIGWLIPAPNGWLGPCFANENKRPDQDPGNPQHFYDAAAGAALLSAGAAFHSQQGKASVLLTGQDLAMAQQWVAGAKSVLLSCQPGEYKHRQDLEGPDDLRVYQRGDDPACIVHIRR